MEEYITGTNQKITVHGKDSCMNQNCCIHNPSNHHMVDWPIHWRNDRKMMERICQCGVGHPDPDDLNTDTVHGCCGCCNPDTFNDSKEKSNDKQAT